MSVNSEQSADSVFQALRELVSLPVNHPRFWGLFVESVAGLCRATVCRIFRNEEKGVREIICWKDEEFPDGFRIRGVELTGRLEKRGYIFEPFSLAKVPGVEEPFLLVFRFTFSKETVCVALLTEHKDVGRFNEVVVRSQLIAALGGTLGRDSAEVSLVAQQTGTFRVLEVLEEVSSQKKFALAAMRLVDELAFRYKASRVSLGWLIGRSPKVIAISGIEKFEKNSEAIAEQIGLIEECFDQGVALQLPEDLNRPDRITQAHKAALGNRALSKVLSIPISDEQRLMGVLTFEFNTGELQKQEVDELLVVGDQSAKWLNLLHQQERKGIPRLVDGIRNAAGWWLGPRNTLTKLLALLFMAVIVAGALIKIDFKLDAPATLEATNIGYLSSPFNGHVEKVNRDSGDLVTQGEVVMELNQDELLLREKEEFANLQRFTREAEKARSGRKLVDMKVALARVAQTEIELKRIRYYLEQSKLVSPISGVIVEGNQFELEGAPVAQGDVLMKVASPETMYVQIKLGERDIDYLQPDGIGKIRLLTQPKKTYAFVISKIIPAAQVDPVEGNVFIVHGELELDQFEDWWRPGMSGTVKLDAGKRSILAVLFHRTWDTIRMWLWI
jgi:hypothetical protein